MVNGSGDLSKGGLHQTKEVLQSYDENVREHQNITLNFFKAPLIFEISDLILSD
jgi:hypothetical protein